MVHRAASRVDDRDPLLNDGVHTSDRIPSYSDLAPEPCLDVETSRRPHVGTTGRLNVRVRATCTPQVHVAVHLRWRTHGGKHEQVLAVTRALHGREARAMAFRLPPAARTAITSVMSARSTAAANAGAKSRV